MTTILLKRLVRLDAGPQPTVPAGCRRLTVQGTHRLLSAASLGLNSIFAFSVWYIYPSLFLEATGLTCSAV